jgi:hypothetical protein
MDLSLVTELRPLFAGRKVVLTGGPLAALPGIAGIGRLEPARAVR